MVARAIGIDLGTTNTVIALDREVLPIRQPDGPSQMLSSCVAFPPSGTVLTGTAARDRLSIDSENTICSFKRIIGRDWQSAEVSEFRQRYNTLMLHDPKRGPVFRTRAGDKTATDLAAIVVEQAVRGAGLDPGSTRAVITVPAAFSEAQRAQTVAAGMKAGLVEVKLLEEPIATALAHGNEKGARYAAVYDIGGGTFDVCVLDCALFPIGMLGHGGDLFLGGDDFNEAIAGDIAATLLKTYNWDLRTNVEAFHRLVAFAERAKIELSKEDRTVLDLAEVDPAIPIPFAMLALDRDVVARSCYNLVRRTFATCDAVFDDLDLSPQKLDKLFLAGGATLMPLVRDWVTQYFGVSPSPEVSPFEVVALGASIAAQAAFAT